MKKFVRFVREFPLREHILNAVFFLMLCMALAIYNAVAVWVGVEENLRMTLGGILSYFLMKSRMFELYVMWLRFKAKESA